MTAIMVYHIRSKYTAVGRKEIVLFFYLYALSEVWSSSSTPRSCRLTLRRIRI